MKKTVCILLFVLMLLGALPFAAHGARRATSGYCGGEGDGGNLTWTLDDDGTLTISGSGLMRNYTQTGSIWCNNTAIKKVVIPNGVTSIGDSVFYGTGLTEVKIPDSVTSIGAFAFQSCRDLKSVTIPDSVTRIGNYAFSGCESLSSVKLPNNLATLEECVFSSCPGLKKVTIPDSVTTIAPYAFAFCSELKAVTIPNSVTTIRYQAFNSCPKLTEITLPDSVTDLGDAVFGGCSGLKVLKVSENNPVFYSVNNCVIQKSTKTLAIGCRTSEIPQDGSVTSIGAYAFSGCTGLTSVTIPDSVTKIGPGAFYRCEGLTSVTIPDSVTEIGGFAFESCKGLKSVVVPDSVTDMDEGVFSFCENLTVAKLPDGLTNVSHSLFHQCENLASVIIPDSVTSIGASAFYGCGKLTSVTIPENVTDIQNYAFQSCSGLQYVSIEERLTSVGLEAFDGCAALTDVYYTGTRLQWSNVVVRSGNYCLLGAEFHFQAQPKKTLWGVIREGDGWIMRWTITYEKSPGGERRDPELEIALDGAEEQRTYQKITTKEKDGDISPWLTASGFDKADFVKLAVRGNDRLSLYIVPSQFAGYTGLTEAVFEHVDTVDKKAFQGCASLKTIHGFDPSLRMIDAGAFEGCSSLSAVIDIYGLYTSIGEDAFKGCKNISFTVDYKSAAENYAKACHIDSIVRDLTPVFYQKFETNFSPSLFFFKPSHSDKELAMLAGMLSWEAEEYDYVKHPDERPLYRALGIGPEDIYNDYAQNDGMGPTRCFTISKKSIRIGGVETNLLIITARGTETWSEGLSDAFTPAEHSFFNDTRFKVYNLISNYADEVFAGLSVFMDEDPDFEDHPLKILVTGHSLGGAAANLIGAKLTKLCDLDEAWAGLVSKDDIFVYTFGALDSINSDGTVSKGFENIHNITNFYDTFGPNGNKVFKPAGNSRYGKFGHIDLFSQKASGTGLFRNHEMKLYMENIPYASYETEGVQKFASWQCPVDVKIFRDGVLVGQVKDNAVAEDVTTIPILVIDDEKYALLEGDGNYTFEMTGTESGTMTYRISDASTGKSECRFENVRLEKGKAMRSAVGPGTAEEVKLFVVSGEGEPVAEIAPDGTEHDVQQSFTPGDVDGNGKVESADARLALRASVKLEQGITEGTAAYNAADYDQNGAVESSDARAILRVSVKLDPFG